MIRGVGPDQALAGRNWANYTWHGDQAPGHPVGARPADLGLRFQRPQVIEADHHGRQEPGREQDSRLALVHRDAWSAARKSSSSRPNTERPRPRRTTGFRSAQQTDAALWLGITRLMIENKVVRREFHQAVHRFPPPGSDGQPPATSGARSRPGLQDAALPDGPSLQGFRG